MTKPNGKKQILITGRDEIMRASTYHAACYGYYDTSEEV